MARGMPGTGRAEGKSRAGGAAALLGGRAGSEPATDGGEDGGETLGGSWGTEPSEPTAAPCADTRESGDLGGQRW